MESSFENPYDGRNTPPPPPHSQHQPYDPPQGSPPRNFNPAAHPDSSFSRLRAERRYSRDRVNTSPGQGHAAPASPTGPPIPPPHRDEHGRYWGQELGYNTNSTYSDATPGADNFGEQAGGGLTGVAYSVADARPRESGVEAMRNTPGYDPRMDEMHIYEDSPYQRPMPREEASTSSLTPLGAAAFPPGLVTPQSRSIVSRSPNSSQYHQESYADSPGYRYSRNIDPALTNFDPNSIEDDGDDGLEYNRRNAKRSSMMSLGHSSSDRALQAGAGGAAAAGGIMGTLGGLVGKGGAKQYDPVSGPYNAGGYSIGAPGTGQEKSEWLEKQKTGGKKMKWLVLCLGGLLLAGAIAGGIVGGVLGSRKKTNNSASNTPSGDSAAQDNANNGDLSKDSAEIKALLNNKNLHKSQMSNTIRLYGTDCNQTEMVLHAIDRLGLNGTMKVWMGVWQDNNATTNARQLQQMYDIFDTHGSASFAGVIVGNEVLFRQDMTITQLGTVIEGVKANMTARKISLPVASSDLGDNWTQAFADQVDILMANIHPFFAGVESTVAAGWTWSFWQNKDIPLKSDLTKNYISETGWPSQGGTDCGAATTCTVGSVAGITEMNNFMSDWVCQSLANGTNYFWFEAFDEPWKIKFDTPGKAWEDQWGLMDVNRNLKPGVQIPSCGGKTVT